LKIEDLRIKISRYFFVFWIIIISPFTLFSQQKEAIRPFPDQNISLELLEKESNPNHEFEKVLREYEALIKKYPDKKELLFNLGNLNYLIGDSESALMNYKSSLLDSDPNTKAHALYNMGNTYYQMGDLQNSVDFFKEALALDPNDEDIRYNYELSKRLLEQQPPQENQDKKQDGEDGEKQKKQDKESQQQQEGDNKEQKSESNEKSNGENEQQSPQENQNKKQDGEDGEEKVEEENKEKQNQKSESQIQAAKEKQLGKEEAEAILNALKANENNLKPRKYKVKGLIKLEKDW